MVKIYLVLIFCFIFKFSIAQQTYGNEWLNFTQKYYKINVTNTGVYKIPAQQLSTAGIDLNTLDPKKLQLFNNGIETAIYITGESDGKFDSEDFILFYGEKNDGKTDQPLYEQLSFQPNPYYSLYTDTASYFLTVSNANGSRLLNIDLSSNGLTPETIVKTESVHDFKDSYYGGAYVLAQTSESEYREGEGYASSLIGRGQNATFQIQTSGHIPGSPISIGYSVIGRSNSALYTNPKGHNHHFKLEVSNNNTNFTTVTDTSFYSYKLIKNFKTISNLNLSNTNFLKFSIVDDLSTSPNFTDYQAISYFKIEYDRKTDLQNVSTLKFSFNSLAQKSLLSFQNNNLSTPVIIDVTANNIIYGKKNTSNVDFTLNTGFEKKFYLFDEAQTLSTSVKEVSFQVVNTSIDADFIIITNKKLLTSAKEYQNYRTETGYNTYLITVDDLYNQFYYGLNHPLAIRNFVQYLQDRVSIKPKYLLLLGKGMENSGLRTTAGAEQNLVHTLGTPPSDAMFSAPLYGNNLSSKIAISRVPAKNNDQVLIYLNKLKDYEKLPDEIERKKIIHISGGNSLSENMSWSGYQTNFQNIANKEFFGASGVRFKKDVNQPIANNLREKIISEINTGASFLSFLGHGSAFATEINFGEPNELQSGKLLFYLINGCLAGNPNTFANSIGENFLFEPNKGAIGWMATSDEGVASYLAGFSNVFYRNTFKDYYGKSVAENLYRSVSQYQNPSDIINRMHSRQYNLQADPAVKFYSPDKPDYYLESTSAYISTENPSIAIDSLDLGIIIKNRGKAIPDSLYFSIERTLADNSKTTYPIIKVSPVFNTDTIHIKIPTDGAKAEGNNTFKIILDPNNIISENNEINNALTFNYYLPGNGINILFPKQNAIVSKTRVELVVQSSNLFTQSKNYFFEIDTVENFTSPLKKTQTVNANAIAKWETDVLSKENQTYYWRARIDLPSDQGGNWQNGIFTFTSAEQEGFYQSYSYIKEKSELDNIVYNEITKKFDFTKTAHFITLETRGDDASTETERTFRSSIVGRLAFNGYDFTTFTMVCINPVDGSFYSYPSNYNFQNYPPIYTGQYFFDLNSSNDIDSMIHYINTIPDGYFVVGFNGRNNNLKGMPQKAKDAFKLLGCNLIGDVALGEPYLFFGEKGTAAGTALEMIADPSSIIPPRNQLLKHIKEYNPFWKNGNILSEKIGPASKWEKVNLDILKENSDSYGYDVIGIDTLNTEQVLLNNQTATNLSISNIDASKYPFLKLRINLSDEVNRTPAQLKSWSINFDDLPENSINLDVANTFYSDKVQEGDSIKWKIGYQNISKHLSDSINVYSVLTKSNRQEVKELLRSVSPIPSGDTIKIEKALNTNGLSGQNNLRFEFQSVNKKDSYSFNNQIHKDFVVEKDVRIPLIDITFDGRHIINKDIVSPSPNILISIKDENNYILLNDSALVDVFIKNEEDANFNRISFSGNDLTFSGANSSSDNKALINYKPIGLKNGIYILKVKSKDKSGNTNPDYEISFEVINESTITNFYPYPNPVVNKMNFVFTLTGEKIPEKIKIQIQTMTGKIVREVLKEELGNIKIGNNISDFTWDGTDQFGDRLANGVYFYSVTLEDKDIKHRFSKGDQFFKKMMGKIYLLR